MTATTSDAVRAVVLDERVEEAPVELCEPAQGSRCKPVLIRSRWPHWALRLSDGDHLPILAELAKDQGVRKLPDYVVFGQNDAARSDAGLRVLICELKSSAAGAGSALRQVQLGFFLVEYMLRLAAFRQGESEKLSVWSVGVIISPAFPSNLSPKGRTRPGRVEPAGRYDKLTKMRVFEVRDGGEIQFEDLFGS